MMKKALLLLAAATLLAATPLPAQTKLTVDYEEIRQTVNNERSYYNDILQLYKNNDAMLRLSDYALLYYGQSFLPQYNGGNDENEKKMKEFVEKENYTKVYETAKKILSYNPVCINALFNASQAARQIGRPQAEIDAYDLHYGSLLYMISQSGDGKSQRSAFKVISSIDQYYLIYGYFEIDNIQSQDFDVEHLCNLFKVIPNEKYPGLTLYTDISRFLLETAGEIKK